MAGGAAAARCACHPWRPLAAARMEVEHIPSGWSVGCLVVHLFGWLSYAGMHQPWTLEKLVAARLSSLTSHTPSSYIHWQLAFHPLTFPIATLRLSRLHVCMSACAICYFLPPSGCIGNPHLPPFPPPFAPSQRRRYRSIRGQGG